MGFFKKNHWVQHNWVQSSQPCYLIMLPCYLIVLPYHPFLDLCEPNPCQNGGTCIVTKGQVTCLCVNPYTGNNCRESKCSLEMITLNINMWLSIYTYYICVNKLCINKFTHFRWVEYIYILIYYEGFEITSILI